MKILFINNDGGGFASHVDVADGVTVLQLFEQRLPDRTPQDFLIRVNRLPAAADQVLLAGDRVSITATKIAGAACSHRKRRSRRCRPGRHVRR
jgi:hypothetical protein